MNINTNQEDIINKIPITLYFSTLPDRKQSLQYITWIYNNIHNSKTINKDQLFRNVISNHLRKLSMKIIEIEILLLIALEHITLEDFTIDSDTLIKKIISQNKDKYDLDVMQRIISQIMTKLPRDLKDRVTGNHKLQIYQKLNKFVNLSPQVLEKFISIDPTLNTPVTMELDNSDYSALNKKYLEELNKFKESQEYLNSSSLEYIDIANKKQIELDKTKSKSDTLKAQYIDSSPDLITGVDNKLYYFDKSSGTMSEISVNNTNPQIPVSMNDLSNILIANKVNKGEIQNLINNLSSTIPLTNDQSIQNPSTTSYSLLNNINSGITSVKSSLQSIFIPNTTQSVELPTIQNMPTPPLVLLNKTNNNISHFSNMDNITNILDKLPKELTNEIQKNNLINKITKQNNNIETVATAFVSIIILLFLLVIFNTIRNKT